MDNARKQSELLCLVVGELPYSGYMLRLTQKHARLRVSTKLVDMPEDCPQTAQLASFFSISASSLGY